MQRLALTLAFFTLVACKGPPARLVTGRADTVIVNNRRSVQLSTRVLDARGNLLDTAVRYRWTSGVRVPVSASGVVTCTQSGDATLHASLGALVTPVLVRCRPVHDVRTSLMMNLVVGGPAQDLPFEVIGVDGHPVDLLSAQITVGDSTIATLEDQRIRGRSPGCTDISLRVGDRLGFASVHVYEPAENPEGLHPGQHVAVRVRVTGGEMRRWRIAAAPELYFLTMLPDGPDQMTPGFAIVGANCAPGLGPNSHFCLARQDASVIVYHPQQLDPSRELSGTLAIWRQDKP